MDVMIMCVKAGMSFESALAEVYTPVGETGADTGICEILRREFEAAFHSIKLGRPMIEALKAIGENTGVPEVVRFANAVAHAEEFGTPIADILDQQSEDLRRERRQKAQEKGQKAGLKMLFPLVGCMFPTIFLLLGGPAILEVMKIMGHK
jgi:tight adherence protein C